MKIFLTKKQYASIVNALTLANYVYGLMGDAVDEKYVPIGKDMDEALDSLLTHHQGFRWDRVGEYDGKTVVSEEYFEEVADQAREYEHYMFWDTLANSLAIKEIKMFHPEMMMDGEYDADKAQFRFELEQKYLERFMQEGIEAIQFIPKK